MYASDMMGDHSIEHCQSLLLLSVMMVSDPCVWFQASSSIIDPRDRTIATGQKLLGPCWEAQSRLVALVAGYACHPTDHL